MQPPNRDSVFSISSDKEFNELALATFHNQYINNQIYGTFVRSLRVEPATVKHLTQIPFLPISFFKTHELITGERGKSETVFTSSTTTSQTPSRHIVTDISLYEKSFYKGFELFYGRPEDYVILALLPNYLEREGSSLVYMFDHFIKTSPFSESGFFLNDHHALINTLNNLKTRKQKTLLIGVTYALLDLAEKGVKLDYNFVVMETGGMKGRRKELLKEELHAILRDKFGVSQIHSEYGMTELLSQAYSQMDGLFDCPPWMKVLIRDIDDPLSLIKENRTGGINVIDLANQNSCAFIATQDLGKKQADGKFEIMGRFDNSDIRGCNLMIEV
jgi:phenylacetate-coenzyme A ligase PaaK-like adenylate-forming protein